MNQVLIELRDQHKLQFSFDDSRLSNYRVSADLKFASPDAALEFLLNGLPLSFENNNGVYLIYPIFIEKKPEKNFQLAGQFYDSKTGESLPFTHLLINEIGLITDERGNFQQISSDSIFNVQASYLGYYLLDTTVITSVNHKFYLKPFNIRLKEVRIEAEEIVRNLQVGKTSGGLRLNHKIASYLPGNGDNSIFNLLRLQPGVLAAGEISNDLIIWGSYEGQSKLMFDGFTLFGMKNFNDNISAVNPFMAKDIQVYKGGYGAEFGERVGGLVNVTGIDGDVSNPHVNLTLNNMTLNGMFSLPINNKASVALAFRQTYYELYDTGVLTFGRDRPGLNNSLFDGYSYPDYNFRDLNFKYSGKTDNGDSYSLSWLGATDRFVSSTEVYNKNDRKIGYDEQKEKNYQSGGSLFYGKRWKNGGYSNFTAAFSGIETQVDLFQEVYRWQRKQNGRFEQEDEIRKDVYQMNQVAEFAAKFDHQISLTENQHLKFGVNYIYNRVKLREDSLDVIAYKQEVEGDRISGFMEDRISIAPEFRVKLGLRADYVSSAKKIFLLPRISSEIDLSKHFRLTGSWGSYKQYLVRSSTVDSLGNYRYFWIISDNENVPIQEAYHSVVGFNYNKKGFSLSVEAYQKTTEGITQYVDNQKYSDVYVGNSKSKGLDFFIKKDWKGHSAWVSYSLSETLQRYPAIMKQYRRALHDQRHEIKLATMLNFKPLFFSMNYVYGSGFPDPRVERDTGEFEIPYKRFDVSLVYQIIARKSLLEAGVSILNVFNYENVKYSNFIRVPDEQEVSVNYHAEAVPLTPTLFINFSF